MLHVMKSNMQSVQIHIEQPHNQCILMLRNNIKHLQIVFEIMLDLLPFLNF